ncbi:MAG: hypothetical protein FWF53_06630 [Candidatus Azobacteroides sp.]|nr:hypothetical protein [Candidatus Azobacteroides sp.]
MSWKKILGGLIGLIVAFFPIVGTCIVVILLFVREKHKLLFIPALCIMFFILGMTVNRKIERQRNLLIASLSQTIENKIFSSSFPSHEKLTIEQFSDTVRSILREDIPQLSGSQNVSEEYQNLIDKFSSDEKLILEQFSDSIRNILYENTPQLSENQIVSEKYQNLIDKCYAIYKTEYAENLSAGAFFYIPAAEENEIQEELNSFCRSYAIVQHPDSGFYTFSMVSFVLLWLFSIPYSGCLFYKYLFLAKTSNVKNIVHNEPPQRNLNDTNNVDIDKIISSLERPSPSITTQSLPVIKINSISETAIREQLNTTVIQAKMILTERETNGNFLDFSDFLKRSGLSERVCNQLKDRLDFSLNSQLNKKPGRVLEI